MTLGITDTQQLAAPRRIEGSRYPLKINSVLTELEQYHFCASADCLGQDIAAYFERYPDVPGVVVKEGNDILGMIARQELLEYLLRPKGTELFLQNPIRVLHRYSRSQPLVLPKTTTIIAAAQQALRRSPNIHNHPILIQDADEYLLLNSHELNIAYWQLRGIETQVRYERAQTQMLKSEKMAALGRLVDGVAHEILEPIGFIWGNLAYITEYSQQLLSLIDAYDDALPTKPPPIQELEDDVELEYLKDDFPRIIKSIQRGAARLKQLGTSLQNFCYMDEVYPKPADLNHLLDSIVLLLKSHLTTKIIVTCEYASLPPVSCFAGQLSQALMNILSDTVERLLKQTIHHNLVEEMDPCVTQGDDVNPLDPPNITITTRLCDRQQEPEGAIADRWVIITITDNGSGLQKDIEAHIQSGFIQEMRLMQENSLSMSYRIITAKHGGQFSVRSHTFSELLPQSGGNTEFEILLPLYSTN
ncbi:MAG: ATP-binding protein [Cyanobacteria bacterium P01_A01_bin.37]